MDINFSAIARCECKFWLPRLVRAAAYEAWARDVSVNLGHRSLCGCRARLDEMRTRPRPQKSDYEREYS